MSCTPIDAERFNCPGWTGVGPPGVHYWYEREGWRRCSHCGSIHPDDWADLVRESVTTGGVVNIDRGKPGKFYVTKPNPDGDKSLHGKFYGGHMPEELRQDDALTDQLDRALRASWDRTFRERDAKSAVEKLGDLA